MVDCVHVLAAVSHTTHTRRENKDLHPSTPPLLQMRETELIMPSFLLAAMVVFMTSSGWPSVVTSNIFMPAPTSRLLNLTGFFSSLGGASIAADILVVDCCNEQSVLVPDRGERTARCLCVWREVRVRVVCERASERRGRCLGGG